MTGHEARDDEREALALVIARTMGGWNDDTTEPEMDDPLMRRLAEEHWKKVNEECLRQGREYANAVLAAGYRKHPEPEWEYGAGYEAYNGVEMRWFSMGGEAYTVREAAENEVARFRDPLVRLVRRTRPGPWVPVGDAE